MMSNPNSKAFVLLSGGLDSTTCLYKAIFDYSSLISSETHSLIERNHEACEYGSDRDLTLIDWVEAVSIHYGQRHSKEIEYAKETCRKLGILHTFIDVGNILADENTMLANRDIEIPNVSYSELPAGVSPTYVPNRNMTMLAVLTAHAQKWVNQQNKEAAANLVEQGFSEEGAKVAAQATVKAGVYFGAHAEDAHNWAYPDCTPEFIGAMANAIYIASYQQVRLHAPVMNMQKADIVRLGYELGVPFEQTWSCYRGNTYHCGTCPTCRSRRDAFEAAGIHDPTIYAAPEASNNNNNNNNNNNDEAANKMAFTSAFPY